MTYFYTNYPGELVYIAYPVQLAYPYKHLYPLLCARLHYSELDGISQLPRQSQYPGQAIRSSYGQHSGHLMYPFQRHHFGKFCQCPYCIQTIGYPHYFMLLTCPNQLIYSTQTGLLGYLQHFLPKIHKFQPWYIWQLRQSGHPQYHGYWSGKYNSSKMFGSFYDP